MAALYFLMKSVIYRWQRKQSYCAFCKSGKWSKSVSAGQRLWIFAWLPQPISI